jgi:hypothetical protein
MAIPRDTHETATTALTILRLIQTRDQYGGTVLDRIRDAHAGQPSATRYDGDKITATGTSDPTASAALRPDTAARDLSELQTSLARARQNLERALAIVNTYTPRPPNALERQRMADANEPHCESCARIEVAKGIPRWEPPLTQERSTVGDRLTEPHWLCRWCYDHVTQTGTKPNTDELDQHHSGARVRCPHPRTDPAPQ